jgi:hypothetical protein
MKKGAIDGVDCSSLAFCPVAMKVIGATGRSLKNAREAGLISVRMRAQFLPAPGAVRQISFRGQCVPRTPRLEGSDALDPSVPVVYWSPYDRGVP